MKIKEAIVKERDSFIRIKVNSEYKMQSTGSVHKIVEMKYNRVTKSITVNWDDGDKFIFNNVELVIY